MKKRWILSVAILCLLVVLTACGGGSTTPRQEENGYPQKFSREREKTMELLDQYGEATRIPMIVSKGKLVEAVDRKPEYLYYGEMKGVEPHGFGVVTVDRGDKETVLFAGEFKEGEPCGYGFVSTGLGMCEADECYFNTFLGNEGFYASGFGYAYTIGSFGGETPEIVYIGEWKASLPHGTGTLWDTTEEFDEMGPHEKKGPLLYEGEFKKGRFDGDGTLYYADGAVQYEGEFKDGSYYGKGTLYKPDGSVKFKGKFKLGEIVN